MNSARSNSLKSVAMAIIGWGGLSIGIYLFCMGPAVRWFPEAAEVIYAPLSPVADWPVLGSAMRGWISFWGVDVGEDS